MKSFLKKLLPTSSPHSKFITSDLRRLNDTKRGMGDTAIKYVLTGAPETVLSTLSTVGGGDTLGVCAGNYYPFGDDAKFSEQRPFQFLDMEPFDGDLLVRYAQTLAAACQATLPTALGSTRVPLAMRIAFSEAAFAAIDPMRRWYGEPRNAPPKGLRSDRLIPLAHALGGTTAQVFEILFWENNTYGTVKVLGLRSLLQTGALVMAFPDDAIKGVVKCPAQGRENFVKALVDWKLVQHPPFLGFVLGSVGDASKSVRAAAVLALRDLPADKIEPLATERLTKGTVGVRLAMVDILSRLGTETAIATLRSQAKTEKTARILAAIENVFAAKSLSDDADQPSDDATGYTAIDGSRVEIPPLRPLQDGPGPVLTPQGRKTLKVAITKANDAVKAHNASDQARKHHYRRPLLNTNLIGRIEDHLRLSSEDQETHGTTIQFLASDPEGWTTQTLHGLAEKPALSFAFRSCFYPQSWAGGYGHGPFNACFQKHLASETPDIRALDALWQEIGISVSLGPWGNRTTRKAIKGDLLRTLMPGDADFGQEPELFPTAALWPYVAENFHVIDHAVGIVANDDVSLDQTMAIRYLATLPKTPMRYFATLLEVATGERNAGKAEARAMLSDVPQVTDRLIALLADNRQAIRKGAAEWLAARGATAAIPALKARLKKEKSELAKAAILTALQTLGEPLDSYVGPTALIQEAETGLKKAKFDKLEWLDLDHLPPCKFKTGKPLSAEVLRWWIHLAFRLKQPGGNALFEIYLDQLDPASAIGFSQWVFDSWVAYDTVVPSDSDANAYAEAHVDQQFQSYKRWYPEITRDQIFAQLKREAKSQYKNSGAATKGLLGLATRVPPQIAAERVRAYLRNHGSRTSQASSLLEMLAHKGDPVSLQVVIAAATRLKQKGVQKRAGELVQSVADQMHWSLDELADRTIPTAGLDESGTLDLPCGVDEKRYVATLGDDLVFVLKNPDGKIVKALSSANDDTTKASKKQLSASKKELKQVITMQTARLYEALCAERVWPLADWQRDFHDHPIMRRLTERVVWQGVDSDNKPLATFRPTSEAEFTDTEDGDVDIAAFVGVRLAHGATLSPQQTDQWATHLKDYEVKPLFAQFGRSLIRLPDDQKDAQHINDRKGWVTETFAIRGAATKLGYERGPAEDGGWFLSYQKSFKSVGLTAVVEFTGNCLPEENRNAALISLGFEKNKGRFGQKVKLSEVPPVLLSECWNDLHLMAAKAAFDPDWEKKTQW